MNLNELGITVLPEYVQSEGPDAVITNLADRMGATSVTTSPYVAVPCSPGTGHREPPIDGGAGKARLLDRPIWGRREVWMSAACSFQPDPALYRRTPYDPPETGAETQRDGSVIGAFLDLAKTRGLQTWLQIQAAIPPCHRVQFGGPATGDHCLMPDGSKVTSRVDKNASLASNDLRAYLRAFVTDLCRAYPQVDGIKFDWPEYPVYQFESLFFDFNPAAAQFAAPLGLDFEQLRRGCAAFLADLSDGSVRGKRIALDDAAGFHESLTRAYPVLGDLIAFRSAIVSDYARFLSDVVAEASGGRCQTFLQCFPPPLNIATGFDLAKTAAHCDIIGIKLYTMHWPLIEANYIDWLASRTDFAPARIAAALSAVLRLSPRQFRHTRDIRYPGPDEAHPGATEDLVAKLQAARRQVPADTRVVGITHGYGPEKDVLRRLSAAAEGTGGDVHINRYGYLSDEKISAIASRR